MFRLNLSSLLSPTPNMSQKLYRPIKMTGHKIVVFTSAYYRITRMSFSRKTDDITWITPFDSHHSRLGGFCVRTSELEAGVPIQLRRKAASSLADHNQPRSRNLKPNEQLVKIYGLWYLPSGLRLRKQREREQREREQRDAILDSASIRKEVALANLELERQFEEDESCDAILDFASIRKEVALANLELDRQLEEDESRDAILDFASIRKEVALANLELERQFEEYERERDRRFHQEAHDHLVEINFERRFRQLIQEEREYAERRRRGLECHMSV